MDLLDSEGGRIGMLVLTAIGILLQWDNLVEAWKAKKGGDSNSDEEKPSPPDGTDWRV